MYCYCQCYVCVHVCVDNSAVNQATATKLGTLALTAVVSAFRLRVKQSWSGKMFEMSTYPVSVHSCITVGSQWRGWWWCWMSDVDVAEPDEKSLITYVSSLYDVFPDVPSMEQSLRDSVCFHLWTYLVLLTTLAAVALSFHASSLCNLLTYRSERTA